MARPIKRWTLRELIDGSDRTCRELIEHLTTDYLPSLKESRGVLKPNKQGRVEAGDSVVVHTVRRLHTAQEYAEDLLGRLEEIVYTIQDHADRSQ